MIEREEIIEQINKLFIYTDDRNWELLKSEVFAEIVFLDMTSLGGEAKEMTSVEICEMWEEGFKEIDSVNHLAGNHLVKKKSDNEAVAFCYSTATHFKDSAQNGKTREFVGKYDFKLRKTNKGWRIFHFVYTLKYTNGNMDLV